MNTAVHNRPTLGGRLFLLVFIAVISFAVAHYFGVTPLIVVIGHAAMEAASNLAAAVPAIVAAVGAVG